MHWHDGAPAVFMTEKVMAALDPDYAEPGIRKRRYEGGAGADESASDPPIRLARVPFAPARRREHRYQRAGGRLGVRRR